jgi:general secretion pathway protein D
MPRQASLATTGVFANGIDPCGRVLLSRLKDADEATQLHQAFHQFTSYLFRNCKRIVAMTDSYMALIIRMLGVVGFVACSFFDLQCSFAQAQSDTMDLQESLPAPTTKPAPGTVLITLQGSVKLDALVGFISQRIGIKFEYSDEIAARTITIRTPEEIPVASLPQLLGSVLRTERLVLADSDTPGWKRIVEAKDMKRFAVPGNNIQTVASKGPATVVTQVFVLQAIEVAGLNEVLQPFLSGPEASIIAVPSANSIVVTDYASSVKTIADLLDLIDSPESEGVYKIYEANYQTTQSLSDQVKGILATQSSTSGSDNKSSRVRLFTSPVGNRIVVAGNVDLVNRAIDLMKQLDVSLGMTTVVYRIRNTTAERVDKLIKGFVEPPNDDSSYQTTVDEDGNLLVVRGSAEVHRQIEKLIAELDTAVDAEDSPIQYYKLRNASAIDVLYSLLALQDAYGTGGFNNGMQGAFNSAFGGGGFGFPGMMSPMGMQGMNQNGMAVVPLPLAPNDSNRQPIVPQQQNPMARPTTASGPGNAAGMQSGNNQNGFMGNGQTGGQTAGGFGGAGFGGAGGGSGGVATLPGGARVSADISTNSLIVYAPSSIQQLYAKLIEQLDQRRPQVLIEAQIIAVNTSDNYTLGVELSGGDRNGVKRLFEFTSFGLSEVNPINGALRIIPGTGFNGTLVDPDVADAVVRALAQHSRARVLAAPKILVNDNSTGKLESVRSVPFASINASQTVSTTSLGGDQQAGTIITVTPHINEDDHLQLDFDVEFSTFTGTGAAGLPPARQIDRVGSSVTIPDGQTIVVGGLKRISGDQSFTGVPFLEKIPIIRDLTSLTSDNRSSVSFFLFIKPMVLRDSHFGDLRYLSDTEAVKAEIPGAFPTSQPELIR